MTQQDTQPPAETLAKVLEVLLTDVQRKAITGSVYVAGNWVLTTQYEDHPDIQEDLSEAIADCVSGILTPLGCEIRAALTRRAGGDAIPAGEVLTGGVGEADRAELAAFLATYADEADGDLVNRAPCDPLLTWGILRRLLGSTPKPPAGGGALEGEE